MSTKSKSLKHAKKMAEKRAAKTAKRAMYASLAGTSRKNKKIRRAVMWRFNPAKHQHLMVFCGNVGCKRCFPR